MKELRDFALLKPNSRNWYIAPTYRQAKTIAWRMLLDMIPDELLPFMRKNEQELSITFKFNNSEISLKGADKEDSLRGAGLDFCILDEYATMKANVWDEVLRPALSDKLGKAMFIGTPKGFNHFYKLYTSGGTNSDATYESFTFKTLDNPYIEPSEVEQARQELDEYTFRQEYEGTFEPIGGRPVFDRKALIWFRDRIKEPMAVGHLHHVFHRAEDSSEVIEFREQDKGYLKVFEMPQQRGINAHRDAQYIIGVDVAEGIGGEGNRTEGDYSSAHVLRKDTFSIVAHWHGHIDPSNFADELFRLGWFYNCALLAIESNNHGIAPLRRLQRELLYPNLFYTEVMDEKSQEKTRKYGWMTTFKTKRIIMDDLMRVISDKQLRIYDEDTINELLSYSYDEKGNMNAIEGMHDDRVVSLAITTEMYKLRPYVPEIYGVVEEVKPRNKITGY